MRLIDADKIRYAKDWVVTDKIPKVGGYNAKAIYRVTKEEIDAMPTVDAVPVVRCKDCKWCNMGECEHKLGLIWANDENYCSLGERKDGAHAEGHT